ncbi:MAG TPA: hypothetical protein VN132_14755 [Bdellovibrio sp.]|nr:hypothetical protein [Bdellovibrio sp.]
MRIKFFALGLVLCSHFSIAHAAINECSASNVAGLAQQALDDTLSSGPQEGRKILVNALRNIRAICEQTREVERGRICHVLEDRTRFYQNVGPLKDFKYLNAGTVVRKFPRMEKVFFSNSISEDVAQVQIENPVVDPEYPRGYIQIGEYGWIDLKRLVCE